mmetsp:Transcript_69719/g.138225  ORF Transcript_69719/g.138225 Transcript_69719/m.138225 type:complete len:652 (-) Transcript_69719:421-2376(-)
MAWGKPPAPSPPPPPAVDVLSILVAIAAVLVVALLFKLFTGRKSVPPPQPAAAAAASDFPRGPLTIVWGSQTGTAEGFGNELARKARQRGFNAKSVDLEEYEPETLGDEEAPVIFLMATHGEGEPTDNAVEFYKWCNDPDRNGSELASLRFAAFALGNSQYEHYCYMGRWAQKALCKLGATALLELGEGNDDEDIMADFEQWQSKLWPALTGGEDSEAEATAPEPSFDCRLLNGSAPPALTPLDWLRRAFPKQTLFECEVDNCRELTTDTDASGRVVHIELQCAGKGSGGQPSTLSYEAADDLAVCCDNGRPLAERTAVLLHLSLGESFELVALPRAAGMAPPLPTPCTVEMALRYYADLRAPVSKQMLMLLSAHASEAAEAERLRFLASPDGKADYSSYVQASGRGLTDVLSEHPSCKPPLASLLELVAKLTPRYYTISSSPLLTKGRVAMSVKVLYEPMKGDAARMKEGVCSTQIGGLRVGERAVVFVRESAFRLPKNPSNPVIMVGPGTGIAPFRAFIEHMSAGVARTGQVRLYVGCRHSKVDYLYKEELEEALARGVLTHLRTAFSRDTATKVYVQQRLKEDGEEIYRLLAKEGGSLYICGGTSMGRDVITLLTELFKVHGAQSESMAAQSVKQMTSEGRLVQELWS